MKRSVLVKGARYFPEYLSPTEQRDILEDVRSIVAAAPLIHPTTPGGKRMTVRMTSAGSVGWITDRKGYRYERAHPSGTLWPAIPDRIRSLWQGIIGTYPSPNCCLVNFYGEGARMGRHQDKDEGNFSHPVLSLSLGDQALFRIGGQEREAPTQSIWLSSGDIIVLEGPSRLAWHGVDKVRFGSSTLLPRGGRINITLRVVELPETQ